MCSTRRITAALDLTRIVAGKVGTSVGPPGLWLAVKMKAPVAFDPYYPCVYKTISQVTYYNSEKK
jgi:hypothetical protein